MTGVELDPARCPICGLPNECEIAQGSSKCWCFEVHIPSEVLERIPPEAQSLICVCRTCATSERSPDGEDVKSNGSA
ncbi:MAG TPA: cysteine-rich CWC family protein [Thermoanaerobaculia bacterium]|nr:cysteine-rich CWC family protein [Thermoanaerobaculia bacterium]